MKIDYKKIAEELIPIFEEAGQESIDLYKKGLKIEIKEDGLIGAPTISACKKLEADRFISYRILFYSLLISDNPTQEKFWYGWYKRAKGE